MHDSFGRNRTYKRQISLRAKVRQQQCGALEDPTKALNGWFRHRRQAWACLEA
jgi:hypothetical protein